MGGRLSMSSLPPPSIDVIRVVHLNGSVEDLNYPVSVGEIAGDPPKYFVCTPAQLVSFSTSYSSSNALPPDTQLELGLLYFKIPFTALQWEAASPLDYVRLATRMTKAAKSRDKSSNARKHQQSSPISDRLRNMRRSKSTPERVSSEQVTMQGRRSKSATERVTGFWEQVESVEQEDQSVMMNTDKKYHSSTRSWKPILETINERSFGRLNESDLPSPGSNLN